MKQKIIKIAQDLEQGRVTTKKARTLLLGLFGVSGSAFDLEEELAIKCPKCESTDIMMPDRGFHEQDKCLECGHRF